jgi:hypothetical protein
MGQKEESKSWGKEPGRRPRPLLLPAPASTSSPPPPPFPDLSECSAVPSDWYPPQPHHLHRYYPIPAGYLAHGPAPPPPTEGSHSRSRPASGTDSERRGPPPPPQPSQPSSSSCRYHDMLPGTPPHQPAWHPRRVSSRREVAWPGSLVVTVTVVVEDVPGGRTRTRTRKKGGQRRRRSVVGPLAAPHLPPQVATRDRGVVA